MYKSASKRKAHILKNHPGAELPPSIRKLRPAGPGEPDPMLSTHTQLTGTIATPPVCCPHCSKQYSSKVWGVLASHSLFLGMLFHHGLCHLSGHKQSSLLLSQSAGFTCVLTVQAQSGCFRAKKIPWIEGLCWEVTRAWSWMEGLGNCSLIVTGKMSGETKHRKDDFWKKSWSNWLCWGKKLLMTILHCQL